MPVEEIAAFLPPELAKAVRVHERTLTELRLRAERPAMLALAGGEDFSVGDPMPVSQIRKIALSMMEHSYYAQEEELNQGFFTMRGGCRVGVGGAYGMRNGECVLCAVGSLCVRISREVLGCGVELAKAISEGGILRSAVILSRPGMGKTTLLRDVARILSGTGYSVGIADERRELAACRDGVPTLDVGPRTDVADGCLKAMGMERLIRSMAPRIIVTDEIGTREDMLAVREAARRGVAMLTTAHAGGLDALDHGMLRELVQDGCFDAAFWLDGAPGRIAGARWLKGGDAPCEFASRWPVL